MKCTHCGAEIGENNAFCLSCGAKCGSAEPGITPPPTSTAVPPPVIPPSTLSAVPPPAAAPFPSEPVNTTPMASRDPFGAPGGNNSSQGYQAPPQPQPAQFQPRFFDDPVFPAVSVGNWLGSLLLLMLLPLALSIVAAVVSSYVGSDHIVSIVLFLLSAFAGVILMLIWAFSRRVNPSKRNFFRATLILMLIMIVLAVVLIIVATTVFSAQLAAMGIEDLEQLFLFLENM